MKVKVVFGIVDFFERQAQTKTGRTQIVALLAVWGWYFLGTAPDAALRHLLGDAVSLKEAIGISFVNISVMFLRDKEAKKEQRDRDRVHNGGGE